MSDFDRILLSMYFPQFDSPINSRFETLFVSISKMEEPLNNKINLSSSKIYPEKIVRNEDKRTSIIIKGIPGDMTKSEIRNIISKYGNINYLFLTKELKKKKNTLMVFLNFINYKTIIPLFMNLRNLRIKKSGIIYKIKIMYSIAQGKQQLIEYMRKNKFYKI